MTSTIAPVVIPVDVDITINYIFSTYNGGNGVLPTYTRTGIVTDATTYGIYISWTDGRTQPTWQDILDNHENGWLMYRFSTFEQNYISVQNAALVDIPATLSSLQSQITANKTRTTSSFSLSLVGTGATGTLVSSTKDSTVHLNVSDSTTSTIGGASVSNVAIKTCATNDSTEGNWTTVADIDNEQTITLAIALQSIQVVKGAVTVDIPAGYYIKAVNTGSGTHSETYIRGQKTIYG